MIPKLTAITKDSVTSLTDVALFAQTGIRIAFSQRHGGCSAPPFASLNLGAYVDDNPRVVVRNRALLCASLDLNDSALARLNSARQVHGIEVATAMPHAYEFADTDALITDLPDTPLLLCFADCVPVIIVDPQTSAISVVHSGWKGTLHRIAAHAVEHLAQTYGSDPTQLLAYIGPHIGLQSFTISPDLATQFGSEFDTIESSDNGNADGSVNLDLGMLVEQTLALVGVQECNIANAHIDTVTHVRDYFSYRAESQVTGRFGALGCICSR